MGYQNGNQGYMKYVEGEKILSNVFNVLHNARNKCQFAINAIESGNRDVLIATVQAYYCLYYSLIDNSPNKNVYFSRGVNFNSYLPIELVNILNFIIELIYDDEISKCLDNEIKKSILKIL